MKKMKTLFSRHFVNHKIVGIDTVPAEGCEWVLKGEGVATRKLDGTCCPIKDGVTYTYKISYIDRHYGGRSFYNDGLYSVDVYELSNGFEIHHKCTGRPLFWLYKDNKPIRCDYSQGHFIDFVLREEFKYESLCEGETK